MTGYDHLFKRIPKDRLHFRFWSEIEYAVRVYLWLEQLRLIEVLDKWRCQTHAPATADPGVKNWLDRQIKVTEDQLTAIATLRGQLTSRKFLDTHVDLALRFATSEERDINLKTKKGKM